MAEFHLWKKETLVEFAEQAATELAEKDERITELEDDLRKMHDAWRKVVAESEKQVIQSPPP